MDFFNSSAMRSDSDFATASESGESGTGRNKLDALGPAGPAGAAVGAAVGAGDEVHPAKAKAIMRATGAAVRAARRMQKV
jgi:hypothetical protein